jgi:hypothetical protein
MKRYAILFGLFALLGGCAQWTLVTPKRVSVGDLYSVQPDTNWNRLVIGHTEIWTFDGPLLQEVRFLKGLDEGDKFLPITAFSKKYEKMPSYKEGMTPIEVAEFIVASLSHSGMAKVETENLRPAKVGGKSGFRFDLTFALEKGLKKKGFAYGFLHDKKLHLIVYTAAQLHFYDRDSEKAENLVRSIRFES